MLVLDVDGLLRLRGLEVAGGLPAEAQRLTSWPPQQLEVVGGLQQHVQVLGVVRLGAVGLRPQDAEALGDLVAPLLDLALHDLGQVGDVGPVRTFDRDLDALGRRELREDHVALVARDLRGRQRLNSGLLGARLRSWHPSW